jgi:stage III sporulation protein AD
MTPITAVGLALLTAVSAMLVRECGARLALPISLSGGVLLLLSALPKLESSIGVLRELGAVGGEEWLGNLLKILAVGYTVEIGADTCRELGEGGLASRLELFGRLEILSLAVPSLLAVLELGISLVREGSA